jgi:hypothetical protein
MYDRLGVGYAQGRQPDPRWQNAIDQVLGGARTVVNVGAGTGSYEPPGRAVLAVEPSAIMVEQRPAAAAPAVRAAAGALPFAEGNSTRRWRYRRCTIGATGQRGSARCSVSPHASWWSTSTLRFMTISGSCATICRSSLTSGVRRRRRGTWLRSWALERRSSLYWCPRTAATVSCRRTGDDRRSISTLTPGAACRACRRWTMPSSSVAAPRCTPIWRRDGGTRARRTCWATITSTAAGDCCHAVTPPSTATIEPVM